MGTILGGPNHKDYNALGSVLGSPYLGKLPFLVSKSQIWGFLQIQSYGAVLGRCLSFHICPRVHAELKSLFGEIS